MPQLVAESLEQLNEGRTYSRKKIEETKLQSLADKLGLTLTKGERKSFNVMTYTKRTIQYYNIGGVTIMLREDKVPGMGADNPDMYVLDPENSEQGIRIGGWAYDNLEEAVQEMLGKLGSSSPSPSSTWNEERLNKLVGDLQRGVGEAGDLNDSQAFDIADGILADEPGLAEYLNSKGIKDPQGWLADIIF